MKKLIIALVAVAMALPTLAQKKFEGSVTYDIEYKDIPSEMAAMEAMLPEDMTMLIKGEKTRVEQSMGMGMSQVVIADTKTGGGTLLMNMMGKKMAIEMSKDQLEKLQKEKKEEKKPEIEYVSGDEKEIAGYKCKKAVVKADGGASVVIYYTEELPAGASKDFKELKGFPLEYTVDSGMFKMKMTATKVSKEKLDAALFSIPDGYDKMTFEEFQKAMGGMMGGG